LSVYYAISNNQRKNSMSMIIELFGRSIIDKPIEEVKRMILTLPKSWRERHSYLLHEWSRLTGETLQESDYNDVGGLPPEV